ncbi:MAG: hypothetical protein AAGD14_06345 [Planctomycetota bacterium]
MPKRATLLDLGVLTFAVLLACAPLLRHGPQAGHDLHVQIARYVGFTEQVGDGELWPRWLVDANGGGGAATFFFYPALPFHVASLGVLLRPGAPLAVQYGTGVTLLILLSAWSWYATLRPVVGSRRAAWSAVLYALGPYHFAIDLLGRHALAELGAFVLVPPLFGMFARTRRGEASGAGFACCYALLIATHLPSALLASGFLLIVLVASGLPERGARMRLAAGIATGLLLASFYLVPALASMRELRADALTSGRLSTSLWFLFDGTVSPDPDLEWRLGIVLGAHLAVLALVVALDRRAWRQPAAIVVLATALLVTPVSALLWRLPILQGVQFPWRALLFSEAGALALLATARRGAALGALLILVVATGLAAGPWRQLDRLAGDERHQREQARRLELRADAPESTPPTMPLHPADLSHRLIGAVHVGCDPARGRVEILDWGPRSVAFQAELRIPTELVVRQLYWTGWRARIEGRDETLPLRATPETGLLALDAPAGRSRIRLTLPWRPSEWWGAALTMFGLAALLALRRARIPAPQNLASG